jgi:hypothetical protein
MKKIIIGTIIIFILGCNYEPTIEKEIVEIEEKEIKYVNYKLSNYEIDVCEMEIR